MQIEQVQKKLTLQVNTYKYIDRQILQIEIERQIYIIERDRQTVFKQTYVDRTSIEEVNTLGKYIYIYIDRQILQRDIDRYHRKRQIVMILQRQIYFKRKRDIDIIKGEIDSDYLQGRRGIEPNTRLNLNIFVFLYFLFIHSFFPYLI